MGNTALSCDHLGSDQIALVRSALSRPPKFGDVEQIRALKLLKPPPLEEGKSKRFRVTVEFSGEYTEYVDANSKEEAEDMVTDNLDSLSDGCEVDITVVEVDL